MSIKDFEEIVKILTTVLGGYTVVLVALFSFLGVIIINRIKEKDAAIYKENILQLEKILTAKINALNSKNETTVFVHKKQYEKEFDEYQDVWQKYVDLYLDFQQLESNADSFENYEKFLESYILKYNEVKKFVLNSRPFLYFKIQNDAKELILSYQDSIELLFGHEQNLTELKSSEERLSYLAEFRAKLEGKRTAIDEKMKFLSDSIRNRWQSMSIIESVI